MNEALGAAKGTASRFEPWGIVLLLLAFLALNVTTAEKTPVVWCDEVMYADPGVNLAQGHGLVSGAWYMQDLNAFWAGNVPLSQFFLAGWLKLFGFGLVGVRSFHYAAVALAVGLFWIVVRRQQIISTAAGRLFFCAMLLLGSSTAFVYRSARPESFGMLLLVLVLLAAVLPKRPVRLALVFILGACLTWTGLQLVAYAAVMSGLIWLLGGGRFRLETVGLGIGCIAGLALLFVFYSKHGVWDVFVSYVQHHTPVKKTEVGQFGGYGGFATKMRQLPSLYTDRSFILIFCLAGVIVFRQWRRGLFRWNSLLTYGIAASLVVPVTLYVIGMFPVYYQWMGFIPIALGVSAALPGELLPEHGKLFPLAANGILVLACLVGLPTALLMASSEWQARSYAPVMQLALPAVAPHQMVFCEYGAYYAVKPKYVQVFYPAYLRALTDAQKSNVVVAVARPRQYGSAEWLSREFGGVWRATGAELRPREAPFFGIRQGLGAADYELKVFQRVVEP